MNDLSYHAFDGAAGLGDMPLPPHFLPQQDRQLQQEDQQDQEQQQIQEQQFLQENQFQQQQQQLGHNYDPQNRMNVNVDGMSHQYYLSDQTFYKEVLSSLHGFDHGEINGANDVAVSEAMASFGFNTIIFLLLMIGYEVVSRLAPSVYAGRKMHVLDDRMVIDIPTSILPFSWMGSVMRTSWLTVRRCGGLDAYFFLRFIRLCFKVTFVSGLWGLVVLMPVFGTGGGSATGWYHFSMANVSNGNWRLWFPTVFMWFLTYYVLFCINEEYKHYLDLRMQYLAEGDANMNPQTQHSLIVEEIPRELRSDTALYSYFDTLFPGKVHSAAVVLHLPELDKLVTKRKRVLRRLEKSHAYLEATGRRMTHVVGTKRCRCFGIETFPIRSFGGKIVDEDDGRSARRGERVDSTNYYAAKLEELNSSIEDKQKKQRVMAEARESKESSSGVSEWIAHAISVTSGAAINSLTKHSNEDGLLGFNKTTGICGFVGQICIDFFLGGFTFLKKDITNMVDTVSGTAVSSTGFVTFNDLASLASAAKVPLTHDPDVLKCSVAPDPRDIIWENVHVNESFSKGREVTSNFFVGLGVLLWSTIIAFIQTWANLDRLSKISGFAWMEDYAGGRFTTFLNGYLPVVALLVVIAILPGIFAQIGDKFDTRKTKTDIQSSILRRYFNYQVANIYITTTAGSVWTALSTILDHPSSVFEILGRSLPTMVGFFVTLIMTKTLAGLPIIMLRLGALLRKVFLRAIFRQRFLTQRELDEVYKRETLMLGVEYPNQLLVVIICFTYACISPIILPVGAIYFFAALIVYKKQILLVYAPEYESGGTMFPACCSRIIIGLICGQVTLIGYMILRAGFYEPLSLIPLPFITYKMIATFDRLYYAPSTQLSLDRAMQLDKCSMVKIQFDEDLYRQPVLQATSVTPLPYRIRAEHRLSPTSSLGMLNRDSDTSKLV